MTRMVITTAPHPRDERRRGRLGGQRRAPRPTPAPWCQTCGASWGTEQSLGERRFRRGGVGRRDKNIALRPGIRKLRSLASAYGAGERVSGADRLDRDFLDGPRRGHPSTGALILAPNRDCCAKPSRPRVLELSKVV